MTEPSRPPRPVLGWAVHTFTASGAILAMLALVAVIEEHWGLALVWLGAAIVVDGVDGSLARWARVRESAPRISGEVLDLVIDYLSYVFVPALFIWRAGLVPLSLAPWLAAAILLSALYVFARADMKTEDQYFRGFPALWNVVAFYLYVAALGQTAGAVVVGALVLLTFAPVHFVHPFRVRDYGLWLPFVAMAWTAATAALLWPGWTPELRTVWLWLSLAGGAILVGLGLWRTVRGPHPGLTAAGPNR